MDHVIDTSSLVTTASIMCSAINHLQEKIRAELASHRVWDDPIYPGLHVSPLLGQLLALKSMAQTDAAGKQLIETFRLAAIIYISNLRARFEVDTSMQTSLYAQKLLAILREHDNETPGLAEQDLRLWCLTVAATSRCLSDADRPVFVTLCSRTMIAGSLTTFEAFLGRLKLFVWDEELLDVEWSRAQDIFQRSEGPARI
jgi:hypothetical protein